jgi:sulfate permease, SulP family
MADYAHRLAGVGGRLYLSGVDPGMLDRMTRNGVLEVSGPVDVHPATQVIGESTLGAYHDAEAWLIRNAPGSKTSGDAAGMS